MPSGPGDRGFIIEKIYNPMKENSVLTENISGFQRFL